MGDTSDERSDRAREPTERSEDRKERKSGGDKDFHSPILAVTIVTQQINS